MNNYEYTARESALKLIEFIRDFTDNEDDLKDAVVELENAFEILRESKELEVLSFALDRMFVHSEFDNEYIVEE